MKDYEGKEPRAVFLTALGLLNYVVCLSKYTNYTREVVRSVRTIRLILDKIFGNGYQ